MPDMGRLSARDIHVFVAGALALEGLHSAIRLFIYPSAVPTDRAVCIAFSLSLVALPLGIAILLGSSFALRLAFIYLALMVFLGFAAILLATHISGAAVLAQPLLRVLWRSLPVPTTLLALLVWSRLRKPR